MFSMEFRKNAAKIGWRCIHHNNSQVLTSRKLPSTCGIIVTGDEVLKGQIMDTNSHFLCQNLYEMGIKVMTVSVIGDSVDVIASKVKEFSELYDYVLTTGGIGPTHDDVTYEAVAKAFNESLKLNPKLREVILDFYKTDNVNHQAMKMARIPESGKLSYGFDPVSKKKVLFPNVSVRNVYLFPGVPELCEKIFQVTKDQLFLSTKKFHQRKLYLSEEEGNLVKQIQLAVEKFPNVSFGSYPKFFHSYYNVQISMESLEESEVIEAYNYLKETIPIKFQVEYDNNPFFEKRKKIEKYKNKYFLEAMNILTKAIKYRHPSQIFLFFDGGKNSTILLHMMAALYDEYFPDFKINAIYVETNPKVSSFVIDSIKNYNLNLITLSRKIFKYIVADSTEVCVIKGTRKNDPNAPAIFKFFEQISVVNPLFNWTYNDVWYSLRGFCLPYCRLYDQGYSSIGYKNAMPNPHLKTVGPRPDMVYYKRAHELEDEKLENAH